MRDRAIVFAVLLLAAAPSLYVLALSWGGPHLGRLQDDGLYWLSAKSLAEGHGYRIPSLPGEPFQTKYPPLLPALLALVWNVWPSPPANLAPASVVVWALVPLWLYLSWRLLARYGFGKARAAVLVLAAGCSPAVAYMGTTLMTEFLFACLLLLALEAVERSGEHGSQPWLALAAGLIAGLAFLAKTAAIPILLTAPFCLALRRQWRRAGLFLLGMTPIVLAWFLWVRLHVSSGTDVVTLYYTNYAGYQFHNFSLSRMPVLLWKNMDGLLTGIGSLLAANTADAQWLKVMGRVLALLCLLGLYNLARRTGRLQHAIFVAGYFATLLVWHFPPNERFVLPVFLILLAGLSEELAKLGRLVRASVRGGEMAPKLVGSALAGAALLGLVAALWVNAGAYADYFPWFFADERQQWNEDRRMHEWIKQNTAPDAVFLDYRDTRLALATGRHAIRLIVPPLLYYDGDHAALDRYFENLPDFLRAHGVTHVVVAANDSYSMEIPDTGRPIVERLTQTDRRFRPVYRSERVALFEFQAD